MATSSAASSNIRSTGNPRSDGEKDDFKSEVTKLRQNLVHSCGVRRQETTKVGVHALDSKNNEYGTDHAEFLSALDKEESNIIREALFALQGISGEHIQFIQYNNGSLCQVSIQSIAVNFPLPADFVLQSILGSGAKDALMMCCEAGCLYRQIHSYIEQQSMYERNGSVARALASALSQEMQSYRNFLVQLEQSMASGSAPQYLRNEQKRYNAIYNLREIVVAIQAPMNRLKTLAILTDALSYNSSIQTIPTQVQQVDAFVILSALHRHGYCHGDTRHATVVHSLIQAASRPWFDMMYEWCTEGRLSDPANEFFVTARGRTSGNSVEILEARYLWQYGYHLDRDKVPVGILEPDLVDLVFVVGKGVNYVRQCLQDGEWSFKSEQLLRSCVEEEMQDGSMSEYSDARSRLGFHYSQTASSTYPSLHNSSHVLRRTLETSAFLVHSHILNSLRSEHNLMQHLYALKQFLLLGQGDFFSALMDGLHAEYERKKVDNGGKGIYGIYRHTLASIVESSLRSTNAVSFSPDILERVQVDLISDADDDTRYMFGPPHTKSSDNRTIWDIFLLTYVLPDPLVAIGHKASMDSYNRMFLLLFRLKRVEFMLNLTWRLSAVLQHALHMQAQYMGISSGGNPQYSKANVLLRQISMTRQSMMHFVGNLKSYLMFEVLEGGWKDLVRAVDEAKTLDEVIRAHDNYLNGILRKSLLSSSTTKAKDLHDLAGKIENLLQLADDFCEYQEELFGLAQELADIAAEKRREAERRTDQGNWGFQDVDDIAENFFGLSDVSKLRELDLLANDFKQHMYELLKALDSKLNGGPAWPLSNDTSVSTPSQYDAKREMNENTLSDQDDVDSLRFLIFQLDNNKYYGITQL